MVLYGAIEAYLRGFDHHLRFIVGIQGLSLKNTALAILQGGQTSYRNSFVVTPLQNTRNHKRVRVLSLVVYNIASSCEGNF